MSPREYKSENKPSLERLLPTVNISNLGGKICQPKFNFCEDFDCCNLVLVDLQQVLFTPNQTALWNFTAWNVGYFFCQSLSQWKFKWKTISRSLQSAQKSVTNCLELMWMFNLWQFQGERLLAIWPFHALWTAWGFRTEMKMLWTSSAEWSLSTELEEKLLCSISGLSRQLKQHLTQLAPDWYHWGNRADQTVPLEKKAMCDRSKN